MNVTRYLILYETTYLIANLGISKIFIEKLIKQEHLYVTTVYKMFLIAAPLKPQKKITGKFDILLIKITFYLSYFF